MHDFKNFCAYLEETNFNDKAAEYLKDLPEKEAASVFKFCLQLLEEYHEWLQK